MKYQNLPHLTLKSKKIKFRNVTKLTDSNNPTGQILVFDGDKPNKCIFVKKNLAKIKQIELT